MRGAIAGCDHRYVVARARSAIFAKITLERRGVQRGRGDLDVARRELVVERQFLKRDVLGVNMVAGFDRATGAANDLPVANESLIRRDSPDRDLVAGRNRDARL